MCCSFVLLSLRCKFTASNQASLSKSEKEKGKVTCKKVNYFYKSADCQYFLLHLQR